MIQTRFTDRHGGVSAPPWDSLNLGGGVGDDPAAVRANRSAVAGAIGVDRLVFMRQVHSATVTRVGSDGRPADAPGTELGPTDGIVTTAAGVALAVLVADCVPILAFDPDGDVIAATHAGRPGSAAGIGPATLRAMVAAGARIERIQVLLGPAVCGRCYEVPATMQADVAARLPGSAAQTSWGTPSLDLRAGLLAQLTAAGVADVQVDPRCTREDPNLYSHRRGAPTGRFAGIIWRTADGGV